MIEIPQLKVGNLRPGIKKLELRAKVVEKGETREVTSRRDGSIHRVAEVLIGDETGTVLMSLWDDDIDAVEEGDVISIENGFTSLFRDSLRVNVGRLGKIQKIDEEIENVNLGNNLSAKRT